MGLSYPRKRDGNEREIVAALRAAGASVSHLSDAGVPDLLVGYLGETYLLEVKETGQGQNKRRAMGGEGDLTPSQVKWWSTWIGRPAVVVRTVDEALAAIGARKVVAA